MRDADNNLTQFRYDALNRQIGETDALNHLVTDLYDAGGRLTSVIDRVGQTRDITYDADNRETGETWIVSGITTATLTLTYDAVNNMLTASNNNGTYTMTYDALNRATVVQDMWGDVLTMTYDAAGDRVALQDNFGGLLTSLYDAAGNLTGVQFSGSSQNLREDQTYNADNQLAGQTMYKDLTGTNKVATGSTLYDAAGRTTSIAYADASNNSLASFSDLYDGGGRITVAVNNNVRTTFAYDVTNQLLGDGSTTVTYDATGNRNNGSYTVGTGNEMSSDGTWNYNFDNSGNIIQKTNIADSSYWLYSYDVANHLTEADQYNSGNTLLQKVVYKNDAFGNRVSMAVTVGGTTTTTRFALDGWNPALAGQGGNANWNVWADLDGSNNLLTRYLRGDAVDQLFARLDSGTPYWELTDAQGSIRTIIDNSANVKDQITYDGWGNATQTNSTYGGRFLYTGREFDSATGLQYNRDRYYNPKAGSWMSQDPLGLSAGDPNVYRYVANNVARVQWRHRSSSLFPCSRGSAG